MPGGIYSGKGSDSIQLRFAAETDLEDVNRLRRQVNDVHTEGEPEIFKPGFGDELRDYIHTVFADPSKKILVAEADGRICGFAVLNFYSKPETPYMLARSYVDVEEFGVDEGCRRQGIGRALMEHIKTCALSMGYSRIELNMWEFNEGALKFYEEMGLSTYRRYMKCEL